METSALEVFVKAKRPNFDMDAYRAALVSDWERGRPEEIAEDDSKWRISGGIIRSGGHEGYVGTMRFDGTPLSEFRSIARSATSGFREVFAKDVDGAVWHVGTLRRAGGLPGPKRAWRGD